MQTMENSFATKLNRLFDEKRKPNGDRYSKKDVVESSPALSRLILWRLETGQTTKPSYEVVKALADFFEVTPGYFFDEHNEMSMAAFDVDREIQLETVLKFFGLDETGRRAVRVVIDALMKK